MEKDNEISQDYQQGFNEGYTITEAMPDLSEKLAMALSDTERGEGFREGRQQLEMEKRLQRVPEWRKSEQTREECREQSHEKEKGDNAPEML